MITHRISGIALESETGLPLSGLFIKAYDKDLIFDDLLGSTHTTEDGRFEIITEATDFRDFFDSKPDIYLKVYDPTAAHVLFSTEHAIRWDAGHDEIYTLRIPRKCLGDYGPARKVQLQGEDGTERTTFDTGDSLMVEVNGLEPNSVYDVVLQEEGGATLITNRLLTNRKGTIESVDLWPQLGLQDLDSGKPLTVSQAQERWGGRAVLVQVRRDGTLLMESRFEIPTSPTRPLLLSTDSEGVVRNGIQLGTADLRVSGYHLPPRGTARVYMVSRQTAWVPGDRFRPVILNGGREAWADVEINDQGYFNVRLAAAEELQVGAYDFIVRTLRYGYEDDDDFLLHIDDIVTSAHTGLVVREEFMASKFAKGGCVNVLEIAGRRISGPPYFRYANAFEVGEPIYGALDPLALDPTLIGKMTALYVVKDKTETEWSDKSLTHLPQLGGNANVQQFKTQSGCINFNKRLLWGNSQASDIGEYEIVADFGTITGDAASFQPDHTLDQQDIIDGYTIGGFRIVPDPGTDTHEDIDYVGEYKYGVSDFPSGTGPGLSHRSVPDLRHKYDAQGQLTDTLNYTRTLPIQATCRFPADVANATSPSQISNASSSYPVIAILHGQGHHYEDYDYLLNHWAANGFIAVSIDLTYQSTYGVARAHMLFEHLTHLKAQFGDKMANNIGLMGHSRGGEGVATAARLNKQLNKGHNINAVISLAPTNQFTREEMGGTWATPYLVIYGSMDGDVWGGGNWHDWLTQTFTLGNSGFALYDRAKDAQKSMLFVYGATHNGFRDAAGWDVDKNWLTSAEWNSTISNGAHMAIAGSYMTGFFRMHLRGENRWNGMFNGEWTPSSVANADNGSVRLFVQYSDADKQPIDDFEGAHTTDSWKDSSSGGDVDYGSALTDKPDENELYLIDSNSPHETGGLMLAWNNTSDWLNFTIPPAYKNVKQLGYQAVSFRMGQTVSGTNPSGAQDLYLTLTDGDAQPKSRSIRVSKFTEIPEPDPRSDAAKTKSAMVTVRIPLHVFEIDVLGLNPVNLENLAYIQFDFGIHADGSVAVDSVEFTK